ncbi:hypothetical protein [Vibrio furnissii]|uniref:hypothetical protein n=1 Tax=Vibrio furnissii TaxID=29494 RepID=UPI00399AFFA7|nr:DUF2513 domain-containing protein [Vibrio fluvialis]
MKTDLDYLKQMLMPFLETDKACIKLKDLEDKGIRIHSEIEPNRIDDKFSHHVSLLVENRLISNRDLETGNLKAIGIQFGMNGHLVMNPKELRLTQQGIDFANMLENNEVLTRLKSDFKNMTFEVIFDAGKTIISALAKQKLQSLNLG